MVYGIHLLEVRFWARLFHFILCLESERNTNINVTYDCEKRTTENTRRFKVLFGKMFLIYQLL